MYLGWIYAVKATRMVTVRSATMDALSYSAAIHSDCVGIVKMSIKPMVM